MATTTTSTSGGRWQRVRDNVGITAVLESSRDVHLILFLRFLRLLAYGTSTLILALYFAELGHSDASIGVFFTLTLVGDVVISLYLTVIADALGRRRVLVLGSVLMAVSGVVFAVTSNYWILLLAATVGVISPSGAEIGPFQAIEQSTLAHLTEARLRSDVFALYVVSGSLGAAGGTLFCGWATEWLKREGWQEIDAFRSMFWVYALIGLFKAGMSLLLSETCEASTKPAPAPVPAQEEDEDGTELQEHGRLLQPDDEGDAADSAAAAAAAKANAKKKPLLAQISAKSRITLIKLCALFFFDSTASGIASRTFTAYFLQRKFPALPQGKLGVILAVAGFVSSVGNMLASSIAKKIGLVQTMVFTHLPSAIFLSLTSLPSSLTLTIVFVVGRACLSSMDQAPRSAFLSAVVLPEERTAVMGIVNTVQTLGQSAGPLITGILAGSNRFWLAFVVAGLLKAAYDLTFLAMFVTTPLEGENRKPVDRLANLENNNSTTEAEEHAD